MATVCHLLVTCDLFFIMLFAKQVQKYKYILINSPQSAIFFALPNIASVGVNGILCTFLPNHLEVPVKSRNFAPNRSRHTSSHGECNRPGLRFFSMEYTKQTLTLAQQIETLKQRGLIIDDEAEATAILDRTSYFRLADYWRPMEVDKESHVFKNIETLHQLLRQRCKRLDGKGLRAASTSYPWQLDGLHHSFEKQVRSPCPCVEPPFPCHA